MRTSTSGSPGRRGDGRQPVTRVFLKAEVKRLTELEGELRAQLAQALKAPDAITARTLGLAVADQALDHKLASDLIQYGGDVGMTLERNGLDFWARDPEDRRALAKEILSRPGLLAEFSRQMQDLEAQKPFIMARVVSIARFGDEGNSLAAISMIAKLAGWNAPDKTLNVNANTNMDFRTARELIEKIVFHEPGRATIIDTEAREKE